MVTSVWEKEIYGVWVGMGCDADVPQGMENAVSLGRDPDDAFVETTYGFSFF